MEREFKKKKAKKKSLTEGGDEILLGFQEAELDELSEDDEALVSFEKESDVSGDDASSSAGGDFATNIELSNDSVFYSKSKHTFDLNQCQHLTFTNLRICI